MTSTALVHWAAFDLVRAINQTRAENATDEELAPAQDTFKKLTGVLGLQLKTPEAASTHADSFIDLLVHCGRICVRTRSTTWRTKSGLNWLNLVW